MFDIMDNFYRRHHILGKGMLMRKINMTSRSNSDFVGKPLSAGIQGVTFPRPFVPTQGRFARIFESSRLKIYLIQSISLYRLLATIVFSALAFKNTERSLVIGLYASAVISDMVDGYLSRRLNAKTYFGKILDLVADKCLTVVSLMYAATLGLDVFPLALIAIRDIVMIGMRLVVVEKESLFPTNRIFGGLMAALLWGNTLVLLCTREGSRTINMVYWGCAAIFAINLVARVYVSAPRIKSALIDHY